MVATVIVIVFVVIIFVFIVSVFIVSVFIIIVVVIIIITAPYLVFKSYRHRYPVIPPAPILRSICMCGK